MNHVIDLVWPYYMLVLTSEQTSGDKTNDFLSCLLSSDVNAQSGDLLEHVKEHRDLISDVQHSKDKTMFITASKDNAAKVTQCAVFLLVMAVAIKNTFALLQLFDSEKLELLKTYRTERPVNSASISPLKDDVSVCVITEYDGQICVVMCVLM